MADQPRTAESTTRGSTPQAPGTPTRRGWVRAVGSCVLVVGCVLVVVAFFAPWFDLSSSMSGLPRDQYVGPWAIVARSGYPSQLLILVLLVLPTATMVGCGLGVLVIPPSPLRRVLRTMSLVLCLCLFVGTFLLTAFPATQGLTYPYYDVSYEYGTWVALGGLGLLFFGIVSAPKFSARS